MKGILPAFLTSLQPVLSPGSECYNPVSLSSYGTFCGVRIEQTLTGVRLPTAVDAWLGIEYGQQPVGSRRFRPVTESPDPFDGLRSATSYGKVCVQNDSTRYEQGEDCLNFNLYRPSGVPLDQMLPTMVWIHGGGFVEGSARAMDGASFVASSKTPIAVVSFNYRLNSLGFLPSKLFEEEGLLNLGLLDQRSLLQFLHKHLHEFGGDPDQITLAGRSAGAHSTAFHYFHNYGEDSGRPLFARAYFQSGAPTARAFPSSDYPLYQRQYHDFMTYLKCPVDKNDQALECLRSVPIEEIRRISVRLSIESDWSLAWPFQPTLGGSLLERPGSVSGIEGTFHHVPALTTTVTNEGKFYTPGNLTTNDDFLSFMYNLSPHLNFTDIALLNELYADPVAHPGSIYDHSPNSTQYDRISMAWSDYAYICPSRETARRVSEAGVPIYKGRFNAPNHPLEYHAWRGVPHTSDTAYTFDSPDVPFKDTAHIYHAYIASFVASGDPNKYRWPGTPEWPLYRSDDAQQLIVNPGTNTGLEPDDIRVPQCEFWNDPERMLRLHK